MIGRIASGRMGRINAKTSITIESCVYLENIQTFVLVGFSIEHLKAIQHKDAETQRCKECHSLQKMGTGWAGSYRILARKTIESCVYLERVQKISSKFPKIVSRIFKPWRCLFCLILFILPILLIFS